MNFHDSVKMKAKATTTGKTTMEQFSGDDLHKKSGKWMSKQRVIDHESDSYKEVVTDPETGNVVHHCEEPLSQHRGHGSAKRKKEIATKRGEIGMPSAAAQPSLCSPNPTACNSGAATFRRR